MLLNPTVPLRNFFETLQKLDPEGSPPDPNPQAKVMKKKLGLRGSKNRKLVVQRLQNGQEMHNDQAITLSWALFLIWTSENR